MRLALASLLVLAASTLADDVPTEVLRELAHDENPSVREAIVRELRERGLDGARGLERIRPPDALAGRVLDGIRDDLRANPDRAAISGSGDLSDEIRWRLGVGSEAGRPVLYFDARTFEDPSRLGMLEYLVAADPPPSGQASKSYEALAGMSPAEWVALAACLRAPGTGGIWLRWRGASGELEAVRLDEILTWAEPSAPMAWGLPIGGNHDETANDRLPPDGREIQIGVALR